MIHLICQVTIWNICQWVHTAVLSPWVWAQACRMQCFSSELYTREFGWVSSTWLLMWSRWSEGSSPPHTMQSSRPASTSYSMRNSWRNQACSESFRYRSRVWADGPGSSWSWSCSSSSVWGASPPSEHKDTLGGFCSCSCGVTGNEGSAAFRKYETKHYIKQKFDVITRGWWIFWTIICVKSLEASGVHLFRKKAHFEIILISIFVFNKNISDVHFCVYLTICGEYINQTHHK